MSILPGRIRHTVLVRARRRRDDTEGITLARISGRRTSRGTGSISARYGSSARCWDCACGAAGLYRRRRRTTGSARALTADFDRRGDEKMLTLDLRESELPGNFTLFLWGDTHIGNIAASTDTMRKFIRKVKATKHGYAAFGGDQLECKTVDNPHFSLEIHANRAARIDAQRDAFADIFQRLEGDVLWFLDGNHEGNPRIRHAFHITEDLRRKFHSRDEGIGFTVLTKVLFPGFRLLDWHPFRFSVNSKAGDPHQIETNEKVRIKRELRKLPGHDCEVAVMHHIHKIRISAPIVELHMLTDPARHDLVQKYTEPSRIWVDRARDIYRIPESERWFASSGAALRTYMEGVTTYGVPVGYAPTELGCLKIQVQDDKLRNVTKVVL